MTTWTIDHHGGDAVPRYNAGDLLVTERKVYRITNVREVASRVWPDRWRVGCDPVMTRNEWGLTPATDRAVILDGHRLHHLGKAYGPGERPGQPGHETCDSPTCEGCR